MLADIRCTPPKRFHTLILFLTLQEKHGVKLGFMSAFVKASADALRAVPAVNGVIDGTDVVYRDYCDISVAVATPKVRWGT